MEFPIIFEINCRCWLYSLSEKAGCLIRLDEIPSSEFAEWSAAGFSHIWLMGVWTTGEKSRQHSRLDSELRAECNRSLPDCSDDDIGGSPYSIAGYRVDESFGGTEALAIFRKRLADCGIRLILDFIPNHVGLDHPWLATHPDFFIATNSDSDESVRYIENSGVRWYACGKDPYFQPWSDTVQLDVRNPLTRAALRAELAGIARLCDGVRCDMAMLLLNDVFQKTWARHPGSTPEVEGEFWTEAIATIKRDLPGFLFIAEVYWDLEHRLQELGFDFTYDKWLYDHTRCDNSSEAQSHLLNTSIEQLSRSVHFLENHDEARAAVHFTWEEHRAAAVLMIGLPGLRLLHQGQITGAKIKSPVQLNRWPEEPVNETIQTFYQRLLAAIKDSAVGRGAFRLLRPKSAWAGNETHRNFVVVQWQKMSGVFDLVVVNLAPWEGQCYVSPRIENLSQHQWRMNDLIGPDQYLRTGAEIKRDGLYLALSGRQAQIFHFEPV